MKRFFVLLLVFLNSLFFLAAAEYNEGSIRLVLNENTGRFSLYARDANSRYQALFSEEDPRTSFISVNINDRYYKLGDNLAFRRSMGSDTARPSFIFESSQVLVTQEFSFIRTANSVSANGVDIAITIENRSSQEVRAGFRFLLDSFLGERGSVPHFYTEQRIINTETLVTGGSENYWVSGNNNMSLMGSINVPNGERPDSVHFANWKRLNDVSWKLEFQDGRNFNATPYSINDSAVCYYYEPRSLAPGQKITVHILLAAGNEGFAQTRDIASSPAAPSPASATAAPAAASATAGTGTANFADPSAAPSSQNPASVSVIQMEWDMAELQDLLNLIDDYLISGIISEEELMAMEQILERFRIKYGTGSGTLR
jgi:hypothetical protein